MYLYRLLGRLEQKEGATTEVKSLYETFQFERLEAGIHGPVPTLNYFLDIFKSLFPTIEKVRRRKGVENLTIYNGVALKQPTNETTGQAGLQFQDIIKMKPEAFQLTKQSDNWLMFTCASQCKSNGNPVLKTVTFNTDCTFEVSIASHVLDLSSLGVSGVYTLNTEDVLTVFTIVIKLNICNGVRVSKSVIVSRFHTLESFTVNEDTFKCLKSLNCQVALAFNMRSSTCKVCQRMTFRNSEIPKAEKHCKGSLPETNESECRTDLIKKLFPNAPAEMTNLLIEQSKNVNKHPYGRRWSKEFICTCLHLFNRSPKCYEMLIESNLLILPSKPVLLMYKNAIKQDPGFDPSIFQWMHEEADRRGMGESDRLGGIIFDEMSIQQDIQIEKDGHVLELTGLTNLGTEGDLYNKLRKGSTAKYVGSHVLQLLFLGFNGFRFPFAYFLTESIQASEMYDLLWRAVSNLYMYGFKVLFTCMDGAQANRSFMHSCVNDKATFLAESPCTTTPVSFMMDISHVIKKIRNNILKSGIHSKSTRLLTLPSDHTIHWQMFVDFFSWDQQNALQLHRKLTKDHIYLDTQNKMRNHLAEQVLDSEMLHAFKTYQNSLGEKGAVLYGLVELLEQTSLLIQIFRDMRPICDNTDDRLSQLKSIDLWFSFWESSIEHNASIPKNKKSKCLMSKQCHEDIHSSIKGFLSLCDLVFSMNSSTVVTPGLINSDVIENIFNQQRSTYNGANTNPNAAQYKKTINSIVLGQSIISKKSNAANTSSAAPFSAAVKTVSRRRKPLHDVSFNSSKVARV